MQLVEDHVAQAGEEAPRVRRGEEQRELLGRGEQDVGRIELLALALVSGVSPVRVSMRDRQPHLADRLAEVALDVDGERLERRDVERVDAAMRLAGLRFGRSTRSVRLGRKPASVLPAPVGAISSTERPGLRLGQKLDLVRRAATSRAPKPSLEWLGQYRRRGSGSRRSWLVTAKDVARGLLEAKPDSGTKRDRPYAGNGLAGNTARPPASA